MQVLFLEEAMKTILTAIFLFILPMTLSAYDDSYFAPSSIPVKLFVDCSTEEGRETGAMMAEKLEQQGKAVIIHCKKSMPAVNQDTKSEKEEK